ncbi:cytochrome-c peroxidase [Shimia marina]|uniref:Cytochrome c551 peroxidase n=1 Tax=Shimia marina TaxID=321267 RepID=A0A0P1F900_9RHOB|nr:cytochrome c peroxidase [Shimia marina]CUH51902.1 Cytochrome c551 peroxidase precursor [Shimia marina]SFE46191.1 cytochrome c peroxidase [Shimia marina]
MRHLLLCIAALMPIMLAAAPLPEADAHFPEQDMAEVKLGQFLFYDPILSGNKTVSCASCHHPDLGTSDGLSLGLGDGATGLGLQRKIDPQNPPEQRIPRHAPALWNLGATEFTVFFHDGRLEDDPSRPSGIRTPLGSEMEMGFDNALSAQAMFPVLSPDEMAGHYSENDVSQAVRLGQLTGPGGAWDILAQRVAAIPAYRNAFDDVIGAQAPIKFHDIANAMAAFIAFEWRANASAFDAFLREETPLSEEALVGMELFYGKAQCSSCHAGQFQTDHSFHAIAMPQIGPGKAARFERHNRDVGRGRVTGAEEDFYRFRTPSLRNVTQTAPYGHSGAYTRLEDVVRHHLDPVPALLTYEADQSTFSDGNFNSDFIVLDRKIDVLQIAGANELPAIDLTDQEVNDIIAFLETLTDYDALKGRFGVPDAVPSGLPLDGIEAQ